MIPKIQKLKDYLADTSFLRGSGEPDTLLNDLYWFFSESYPPPNDKLRDLYAQARQYTDYLTLEQTDALYALFGEMGMEQERLAFQNGVLFGVQLPLELLEQA